MGSGVFEVLMFWLVSGVFGFCIFEFMESIEKHSPPNTARIMSVIAEEG